MQRAGLNHSSVEKFPVETLAGRSKIYFRPDRDGHNRATFPIRKKRALTSFGEEAIVDVA